MDNLWNGDWVQTNNENDDIDYVQYDKNKIHSFAEHMNPIRLGVPRYMNIVSRPDLSPGHASSLTSAAFLLSTSQIHQLTWLLFLGVYTQAVASPLYKLQPNHSVRFSSSSPDVASLER